ncbi:MAG: type II secretion system F family protein [Methylomonas sp.]
MTLLTEYPWLLPLLALSTALAGLAIFGLARNTNKMRPADIDRRFRQAFGEKVSGGELGPETNWLESVGNRVIRRTSADDETKTFLIRAGWKRKSDLAIFYALQTLSPIAAVTIASYAFFIDGIDQKDWALLFVSGSAAFLLPKRILAYQASARQARIAEQTPVLVHLLRVLLSTGLSVEQALRSLAVDTRTLLPDLAAELDYLLRRIEAGDDIAVAMEGIAVQLDVPALTDLAMILEQTWRMGGSVLKSLAELSKLIEDRMQTDLKERVSKLSGKMTIVMMLFLFPALLVFLAAPGFLAIIQGLKNATG